jgi:hypothetical protein
MNLLSSGITISVYAVVGPNCASLPPQKVTPERFSGRTSRPGVSFRERPGVFSWHGARGPDRASTGLKGEEAVRQIRFGDCGGPFFLGPVTLQRPSLVSPDAPSGAEHRGHSSCCGYPRRSPTAHGCAQRHRCSQGNARLASLCSGTREASIDAASAITPLSVLNLILRGFREWKTAH